MRLAVIGALGAVLAAACAPPGAPAARTSPSATPGSIAAAIPAAEKFVEQHRGLKFKHAVDVQYLDDAAFTARIVSDGQSDPKGTEIASKELLALHLMPPGTDLQHAEDELLGAGVIGFYDPKTKELVVRGDQQSPQTQHVLVHELTHALQDQWFDLSGLDENDPTIEQDAFRTLVEGDARRIETEYLSSLPADKRRQAEGDSGAALPADVPVVLAEMLSFPYVIGPPFTEALLARGGQKRLDQAFTSSRPKYTAEVMHPDRYLAGFQAVSVDQPAAAGTEFDHGIFGEEDLFYVLERVPRRPAAATIRELAGSWRGDSYVAYDRPDGVACLRAAMALDSAAHAQQLAGLLRPAAGYTVDSQSGSSLGWTACA